MTEKENYLAPETEEITLCMEKTLLDLSTQGFTEDESFNNSGWVVL